MNENSLNESFEVTENSPRIDYLPELKISLKEHQYAMIHKCLEVENMNICGLGIMNDKPGAGKTYAILGLIYKSGKKRNIIVVPQNIINQWVESLNNFSNGLLTYKKITDYFDILEFYNEKTDLFDYDVLLTTSLYYHVIATTMESNFLNMERVFFDEVDSISSFLVNKINANFIWFVSASFDYNDLGIFTSKIDIPLLPYITCKCNDNYVDSMFMLDDPTIYKIICKNIYLDNIFQGLFTQEEFKILNALDYSKLKKKFYHKIAQNETEAIDYLVKDKTEIIEIEKIRIQDLELSISKIKNDRLVPLTNDTDSEISISTNIDCKTNLIEESEKYQSLKMVNLETQLEKSKKSLQDSEYKLNLIMERLKENNCCPLCYEEFNVFQKKAISPCCKNTICFNCTDNWFNNLKKTSCIYCNKADTPLEEYILVKPNQEEQCLVCDKEFEHKDNMFYSRCCNKKACNPCLSDWFNKLLKTQCLYCSTNDILFDDFKNDRQYEDMKLNELSGIKYIKKTKIEFIEYFIKTKIRTNTKVIFCSNYIKIFNIMKKILGQYKISYIELDDGNIEDINNSIQEYKYGKTNILLSNSNFFGCGLNLECTTDIVFLHKTDPTLEKQIIGRAQRSGRTSKLNLWYIMHENESIIKQTKTLHFEAITTKENDEITFEENYLQESENYTMI